MAKQRYYLDTRVLTAFFFAAMPFVAFGSFIVVNQARNHAARVGRHEPRAAGRADEARPRAVPGRAGRAPARARARRRGAEGPGRTRRTVPEADVRQMEQAWASGKDAKLNASILETPLAARLKPLALVRPVVKQVQVLDSAGRVLAASGRGGRLFYGETEWFKDLATQLGDPEVYVGEHLSTGGLDRQPPRDRLPGADLGRRPPRRGAGGPRRRRPLHRARPGAHRPHGSRVPPPLDRRPHPRLRRERADPQDAASGLRVAAQRGGGLPDGPARRGDLRAGAPAPRLLDDAGGEGHGRGRAARSSSSPPGSSASPPSTRSPT